MKIPKHVIAETRSGLPSVSAKPFRMAQPVVDDAEEPTAAQPAAPWSELHAAVTVPRQVVPGDLLYDAVLAVGDDDAAREALFASATQQARQQFVARVAYVEMCDGAHRDVAAFETFIASLRASDDETRTAILASAPHPHLVELGERLREPDPLERYMQMVEVREER